MHLSEIRVEPQSRDQAFDRQDSNTDHPLREHNLGRQPSIARRCVPDISLMLLKGTLLSWHPDTEGLL